MTSLWECSARSEPTEVFQSRLDLPWVHLREKRKRAEARRTIAEIVKRNRRRATDVRLIRTCYLSRETKRQHEIAGARLRKGISLVISPWRYHRDPRFWSNPDVFDTNREFVGDHYMPFGVGPRACVGLSVAMLELQPLALEFAAALEIEVATQAPAPPPKPVSTPMPPSIGLRVRPRVAEPLKQRSVA
jgi:hypothetical protein